MILQACPYYTMFPLDFPLAWLRKGRAGGVGAGSLLRAGHHPLCGPSPGLPAAGADVSPVAAAIAEGMLGWARPEEILGLAARLLQEETADPPEGEFWELAYHRRTLEGICRCGRGCGGRRMGMRDGYCG
jgi:hypothetical protein